MAKLFVKQDGGFRYLGEGTIYKKSQLNLVNEVQVSLYKTTSNVATGAQEAQKQMNQQPSVNSVKADAGRVNGNANYNGTVLNVDVKSPESIKQGQAMLNAVGNNGKAHINYYDGTKTQPSNTNITEMNNVISFTKKELNNFLKNL